MATQILDDAKNDRELLKMSNTLSFINKLHDFMKRYLAVYMVHNNLNVEEIKKYMSNSEVVDPFEKKLKDEWIPKTGYISETILLDILEVEAPLIWRWAHRNFHIPHRNFHISETSMDD